MTGRSIFFETMQIFVNLHISYENFIPLQKVGKIFLTPTSGPLWLMGEGFIKALRIFFWGVYHPPFDTLKIGTSTDDIKLKLYR